LLNHEIGSVLNLKSKPSEIVAIQSEMYQTTQPQFASLKLPRVFTCLKRALEDLGGLRSEGIFRVAGNFTETQKMMEQLSRADYSIQSSNPITIASVLKKWVRDLNEPLIPPMYHDCCKKISDDLLSDSLESRRAAQRILLFEVFNELEPASQLVIKGLVQLFRDISCPTNIVTTKMTPESLGIVFSPSFVHEKCTDPGQVFVISRCGAAVITSLMEVLDTSDYPGEEENITKSPFIKPVAPITAWARGPMKPAMSLL